MTFLVPDTLNDVSLVFCASAWTVSCCFFRCSRPQDWVTCSPGSWFRSDVALLVSLRFLRHTLEERFCCLRARHSLGSPSLVIHNADLADQGYMFEGSPSNRQGPFKSKRTRHVLSRRPAAGATLSRTFAERLIVTTRTERSVRTGRLILGKDAPAEIAYQPSIGREATGLCVESCARKPVL